MNSTSSFDILWLLYLAWMECDEVRFEELYRELWEVPSQEAMP